MSSPLANTRSRPGVAEQRKRVLEAARELLSERGAGDITAKHLADRAGVSRATFYRCFDNVDAVIDALYNEFRARVTQRLERHIQPGANPTTWLRQLVGEVLDDAVEMGPYLVALYREELRPGSPAGDAHRRRVEAQIDRICDWWLTWADFPADRVMVRAIVLLPQAAGISMARADVTAVEKERLENAVMFMIQATIEHYLRSPEG